MKQIYNFESYNPPVLNESMLRAAQERRLFKRYVLLIAMAAILFQIAILLFGMLSFEAYPWVAFASFVYVISSTAGAAVLGIVATREGGTHNEQYVCNI